MLAKKKMLQGKSRSSLRGSIRGSTNKGPTEKELDEQRRNQSLCQILSVIPTIQELDYHSSLLKKEETKTEEELD
jgi:hypothetical protein